MLQRLAIRNVALIDFVEMEFCQGLNVLSGETGSGKSVIADAICFVLGERADKSMIKHGKDYCLVEAFFCVQPHERVCDILKELDLYETDDLILSRKFTQGGKSEIRINGRVVTLAILREITANLVDVFGQSEHQCFLKKEAHKDAIDEFAEDNSELAAFGDALKEYKRLLGELKSFGGNDKERNRKMELLEYEIKEIERANLDSEEEKELIAKRSRMLNAERLANGLGCAENAVGENALSSVGEALTELRPLIKYDSDLEDLDKRLDSVKYELRDIYESLAQMRASCDYSPAELEAVEERLEVYKSLKRKYGDSVEDILVYWEGIDAEYKRLQNASVGIARLEEQIKSQKRAVYDRGIELSRLRQSKAKELSSLIERELGELGMKNAKLEASFLPIDQADFLERCDESGLDDVEFLMSANLGEPLKPLIKVISGGEMSRFMLAVKNITAKLERIPTMLFDEIDTGISGKMAEVVAWKLSKISRDYQCLVITHLVQPMAVADRQFVIEKTEKDGATLTSVAAVEGESRIAELARVLGGDALNSQPLAREFLKWGEELRKKA
ncbi:MAG: DNA repair protein RecN [Clostridia bacterium]|nr:DNA repair protein RecN [Clostridia bacterium]